MSLFGGGTDFREFFETGGGVLSSAIDKYIFVVIKGRFDDKIRVGYWAPRISILPLMGGCASWSLALVLKFVPAA